MLDEIERNRANYSFNLYQQFMGTLLFATIYCRPDYGHAVQLLSRELVEERLTMKHFDAAFCVLLYAEKTKEFGLKYSDNEKLFFKKGGNKAPVELCDRVLTIECYSDASFAERFSESRSTTGYGIYINNNLVQWCSKQQPYVANSTAAAEYIAMAHAVQDCIWMYELLIKIGLKVELPIKVYGDNQAEIKIVKSFFNTDRLRGVRVAYHTIKHEQRKGVIDAQWIETEKNIADIFTKPLGKQKFFEFRSKIVKPP